VVNRLAVRMRSKSQAAGPRMVTSSPPAIMATTLPDIMATIRGEDVCGRPISSELPHVSPSCGKGEQFAPSHEQLRNRLGELMDKLDLARLLLIVNPGGWPTVPWKAWSASRATSTWLASGLRALKNVVTI
jgi:hypothetical protein